MISRESDEKSDFDVDITDTTSINENTLDMDLILLEEVSCSDIFVDFIDEVLFISDELNDVDSTLEDFLEQSINFDEGSKESKLPEVLDVADPDVLDGAPAGHDISDDVVSEHDTDFNFFDCEASEKVFEDLIDVIAVDENTEDEKN